MIDEGNAHMLDLGYARDLVMVGAIFGVAGFVWAGWAQENPPKLWGWRVVLALHGLAGLALAALSIPLAIVIGIRRRHCRVGQSR